MLEQNRNQMFARKGRGEQLATKEKMDDWIKEEMMIMDGGAVGVKQIQMLELSKVLKTCQDLVVELVTDTEEKEGRGNVAGEANWEEGAHGEEEEPGLQVEDHPRTDAGVG